VARQIKIWLPEWSIGDEQGAVVVKDSEDLHAELALIVSEAWWVVVTATNKNPIPPPQLVCLAPAG
jgi:hypothetical protein